MFGGHRRHNFAEASVCLERAKSRVLSRWEAISFLGMRVYLRVFSVSPQELSQPAAVTATVSLSLIHI